MSLSNESTVMTMPVAPVYQGNNGFGNGWGGDRMSWLLLFVLFGGWGYGGFGGWGGNAGGGFNAPGAQGYATRADINEGFALNGLQNGQASIKDAVTNGFHGVDNAVCQLGYQLQQCCCDNARAIDGVNYNMATQAAGIQNAIQGVRYDMATQACDTRNTIQNATRDLMENSNANSRAILDALNQNYIRTLENENQSLKLAASQANQNAVLTAAMDANQAELIRRLGRDCPIPAYVVPNPNCCYNPCGTCA